MDSPAAPTRRVKATRLEQARVLLIWAKRSTLFSYTKTLVLTWMGGRGPLFPATTFLQIKMINRANENRAFGFPIEDHAMSSNESHKLCIHIMHVHS